MGAPVAELSSKGVEVVAELPSSENAVAASALPQQEAVTQVSDAKPKKKICCACPDTRRLRDECIVEYGEAACIKWIEAHRRCLRAEGFNV